MKEHRTGAVVAIGACLLGFAAMGANSIKRLFSFRSLEYETGGSFLLYESVGGAVVDGPNPMLMNNGSVPLAMRQANNRNQAIQSFTRNSLLGGGLKLVTEEVTILKTEASTVADNISKKIEVFNADKQKKVRDCIQYLREILPRCDVYETFRSQARQDALWAQGREPSIIALNALRKTAGMAPLPADSIEFRTVVTWTKKSEHTLYNAFDVVDRTASGDWSWNTFASSKLKLLSQPALKILGIKQPLQSVDPWHFEFV